MLVELGVKVGVVIDGVDAFEPGAAAELLVVDQAGAGYRLAAGDFVGTVFGDDQGEVGRRALGHGDEHAQGHQGATVAVDAEDPSFGLCDRQAEGEIGGVAHSAFDVREI